jgi:hypothetical protein
MLKSEEELPDFFPIGVCFTILALRPVIEIFRQRKLGSVGLIIIQTGHILRHDALVTGALPEGE